MRALYVPAAGARPELGELPTPTVTDGSVLIRVRAAGLNPVDNGFASGMLAQMLPHEYPLVLGRDAAGVVEAVGGGVDHVQVGDEVFGHILAAPPIQAGTLGEYAVLPAAAVATKPAALDFVAAAAIPLAGAGAAQTIDAIDPHPGQTVLVNGASGGVGSFAVQLLAARDATVIGTSGPDSVGRVRELGAAEVIDYTAGPVADQVRNLYPDGVDALINLAGLVPDAVPVGAVKRGGKIATLVAVPDEDTLAAAGVTSTSVMATPLREIIAPLAAQAADGTLKIVATALPLDQALDGLTSIAAGQAHGKVVVTLDN